MDPREAPRVNFSQLQNANKGEPYTWEEIQLINRYCGQTIKGVEFTRNEEDQPTGYRLFSVNAWCE